MHKRCFLFGHRDTPDSVLPRIEQAAETHYCQYGIREFVVGNRGNFDRLAARAVRTVKEKYPDIRLTLLLAYPPASVSNAQWRIWDSFVYPDGLETIPPQHAIPAANRYMVEHTDCIICYVAHAGNTRTLLHAVHEEQLLPDDQIDNLADDELPF